MRFSDRLTWAQYLVAQFDEIDLEARLYQMVYHRRDMPMDDVQTKEVDAHRAALRKIERSKSTGAYEVLRADLQRIAMEDHMAQPPATDDLYTLELLRRSDDLGNFRRGLESKDPDERRLFESFKKKHRLAQKSVSEIAEELAFARRVAHPPKRRGPARKIPPWKDVVAELDAMRIAVSNGTSVPEAARKVADSSSQPKVENRWKTLEDHFRVRADFRRIN